MMSYLWILLMGSLLAAGAAAQEEAAEDLENPAPEVNPTTEVNGEPDTDEETGHTTEKAPPTGSDPEPSAEPEDDAHVTPAGLDEELTSPAGDDVETPAPADDDEETPAPADDDAETPAPVDDDAATPAPVDDDTETPAPVDDDAATPAPADDDTEAQDPADDDAEAQDPADDDAEAQDPADDDAETPAPATDDEDPEIPADGDTEAGATTPAPEADPNVDEPEAEQTTANAGEVEPSASSFGTPAPEESDPVDKAVEDNEEEPTKPPAEAEVTDQFVDEKVIPDVRHKVNVAVPTDDVEDNMPDVNEDEGFNLEDALSNPNPPHPGKSRSLETGAHVAGTTGDADEPQPRASSGSLAGILCAIGVAAVGAVTGYFTYQRKQLCFKNRQEADPEAARKADVAEADPQVLSNLLNSS